MNQEDPQALEGLLNAGISGPAWQTTDEPDVEAFLGINDPSAGVWLQNVALGAVDLVVEDPDLTPQEAEAIAAAEPGAAVFYAAVIGGELQREGNIDSGWSVWMRSANGAVVPVGRSSLTGYGGGNGSQVSFSRSSLSNVSVDWRSWYGADMVITKVILDASINPNGAADPRTTLLAVGASNLPVGGTPVILGPTFDGVMLHHWLEARTFLYPAPRSDGCVRGAMVGWWQTTALTADGRSLGRFSARIHHAGGARAGYVRGVFGDMPSGEGRILSKLVNEQGQFLGLASGSFQVEDFDGMGSATMVDVNGTAVGGYSIDFPRRWPPVPQPYLATGFVAGLWRAHCP